MTERHEVSIGLDQVSQLPVDIGLVEGGSSVAEKRLGAFELADNLPGQTEI